MNVYYQTFLYFYFTRHRDTHLFVSTHLFGRSRGDTLDFLKLQMVARKRRECLKNCEL
jgi:hypothetical protein